jgi:hypothetical protein
VESAVCQFHFVGAACSTGMAKIGLLHAIAALGFARHVASLVVQVASAAVTAAHAGVQHATLP